MSFLKNIKYRITGDTHLPKIIFLHGLMGFLNNWGQVTRSLNSQYCCLVYDQRGHGKSFKPDSGYQPEDYAMDLWEIINELGWDKITLVGHSMGGRNALCFANRYPERIEKLVIVDISPVLNEDSANYFENLLSLVPTPFNSIEAAKIFFEQEFMNGINAKEEEQVLGRFLFANLETKVDGKIDWRFSKSAIIDSANLNRHEGLWDWFKDLNCPCLYVRGQNSKYLPQDVYNKVLSGNNKIQGVEISDAGHWVHSEQPDLFLKELKNFIGYNNY